MIWLRKVDSRLHRLLSATNRGRSAPPVVIPPDMVELASAIFARHAKGHTTTLRQLHLISSLSQPQALTLIHALEQAGIVQIESNLDDAFESTVTLTEEALRRFEAGMAEDMR